MKVMSPHAEAQWLRPHQVHNVTLVKIDFHQDRRLPRNYSSQRGDAGVRCNGGNDAEQFRRNFLNWLKILPFFFFTCSLLEDLDGVGRI